MPQSAGWLEGVLRASFGAAVLAFPRGLRADVGEEMTRAFVSALRVRLAGRGRWGALAYGARSLVNVIAVGLAERLRRRGPAPVRNDDPKGDGVMAELFTDLRHGARRLRKMPAFTIAAVAMLALAVGANTAVFSALKAVLLSPPPFPAPDRLVWVSLSMGESPANAADLPWSWPKMQLLGENASSALSGVAGYGPRSVTLSGDGVDPQRVRVEVVTPRYFDVLLQKPLLGRWFTADEAEATGGPLAVVLGNGFWRDRFAGATDIIGRVITLNDKAVQVVGVAPAGFEGLSGSARAWVPVPTGAQLISPVMGRAPHAHWLFGFGRLADGIDVASAPARLANVGKAVAETYPMPQMGDYIAVKVESLTDARSNAGSRTAVLALMGGAGMVLLIACANLAALLLARGRSRARDAAIRLALGAGRMRVVRSALAESMLLALTGGAAGLVVAHWSLVGMRAIWPDRFLRAGSMPLESVDLATIRLDGGALLFALGATLLTALLFGLAPALRHARVPVRRTLVDGSGATRRRTGARGMPGASALLVATQTALALILLVGAGLMLGSLVRLAAVDPGFDTSRMLVADLTFSRNGPSWEKPVPMREAIVERVSALAGVESATIDCPPLNGFCWRAGVRSIDGRESEGDGDVGVHMIPDGFFATMGVPLHAGRTFGATDAEGTRPVVVLNELAARQLFGDGNAIGHSAALTIDLTDEGNEAEVIGVVGDVVQGRPDEGARAEAYFSERQMSEAGGSLMVRTRGEPLDAVASVRAAVRDLDPAIVLDGVRTMDQSHARGLGDTRIVLVLLGLFAVIALVLAGAGIWGVVALSVAERRQELGLRMALGAHAGQLVGVVMRQGMTATLAGAAVGAWAAWGLARLLSSLLFGTDSHDPLVFAGAAGVLLIGAAIASLLPARQATRVDPARTLRTD